MFDVPYPKVGQHAWVVPQTLQIKGEGIFYCAKIKDYKFACMCKDWNRIGNARWGHRLGNPAHQRNLEATGRRMNAGVRFGRENCLPDAIAWDFHGNLIVKNLTRFCDSKRQKSSA